MAKNYSNITITSSSSDTYHTFEKTYNFDGIYRRIISGNTLGTTITPIIKTQSLSSESTYEQNEYALTVPGNEIEYVRIRNLHASNILVVQLYNSELGKEIWLEIQGEEVLQFHSQLKFDNSYNMYKTDYIFVDMESSSGGADIFIGFSA